MRTIASVVVLAGLCALSLWSVNAAASESAAKLRGDPAKVTTYTLNNGRFVKGPPAANFALGVELQVIEESPRGYVLVQAAPGPVWLDKMDVKVSSGKEVKHRCLRSMTSAADTTAAITRGAGERCKP